MVIGTIGAILFSLYIKKSFNYKRALRIISLGSTTMLLIFCLWMLTVNQKFISTVIISVLGFMITPIVPVSYDLGCELAFPIG
jgi:sugar phosphate permease